MSQSRKKTILEGVQKKRRQRTITTLVVVAVIIAIIVGGIYALSRTKASGLPPYLDICVSGAGNFYHAHAHIGVVANGSPLTIPAGTGIEGSCLRPLHVHSADAIIHIEPDNGDHPDYSLKDFFAIWRQPFNSTNFLSNKIDSTHVVTLTVNGQPVAGAPESYLIPRTSAYGQDNCSGQFGACVQEDILLTYGPPSSSQ